MRRKNWSFVVALKVKNSDGTVEYITRRGTGRTTDRHEARFFGTVTDACRVIDEFKAADPEMNITYETFESLV